MASCRLSIVPQDIETSKPAEGLLIPRSPNVNVLATNSSIAQPFTAGTNTRTPQPPQGVYALSRRILFHENHFFYFGNEKLLFLATQILTEMTAKTFFYFYFYFMVPPGGGL
jgi:hypothetical protein